MELERLGKYELVERLGRGGMGEVWRAFDTGLRRNVAIKILHADLQANPDFVTHFMREAQLVASLHHPNIVQIHDFQLVESEGSRVKAFMVMDYIEGGTLADYIAATVRKGIFPPASEIAALFTAIGLALDYAHSKGMIHRDIKPENILLDRTSGTGKAPGEPILTDFGIARMQGTSESTLTRSWLGTPRYLSPEQAEGHAVDKRTDLYSLGIVLYEMLTGITPFRGDNPFAIMMQHVHQQPPPPALINPSITPTLSVVVLQSIAKDPAARFPSASARALALALAFNLPVPASLSPTRSIAQHDYNPLQPSISSPGQDSRTLAATATPQGLYSPIPGGYTPAHRLSPPAIPPAPDSAEKTEIHTPAAPPPKRPRRRTLYIALAACALLVLGLGSFFALSPLFLQHGNQGTPTPGTASAVVGTIVFQHSSNTVTIFDQVQVTINHITNPSAGTTYYAWLETSGSDTAYPNWPLQVSNGVINATLHSYGQYSDLYTTSTLFLITAETVATPIVPNPTGSVYYATITHTPGTPTTFEIKQCPQSGVNGC